MLAVLLGKMNQIGAGRDLERHRDGTGLGGRHAGLQAKAQNEKKAKPNKVLMLSRCKVAGIMTGAIVTRKTANTIAKALGAFRNEIDKMPENA